jgi:hypothetical protein
VTFPRIYGVRSWIVRTSKTAMAMDIKEERVGTWSLSWNTHACETLCQVRWTILVWMSSQKLASFITEHPPFHSRGERSWKRIQRKLEQLEDDLTSVKWNGKSANKTYHLENDAALLSPNLGQNYYLWPTLRWNICIWFYSSWHIINSPYMMYQKP